MQKKDDKFYTIVLIMLFTIMFFIVIICVLEFRAMLIDHQCYMMEDEEFFQTEMCKPYWRYRQEDNK